MYFFLLYYRIYLFGYFHVILLFCVISLDSIKKRVIECHILIIWFYRTGMSWLVITLTSSIIDYFLKDFTHYHDSCRQENVFRWDLLFSLNLIYFKIMYSTFHVFPCFNSIAIYNCINTNDFGLTMSTSDCALPSCLITHFQIIILNFK